MTFPREIIFQNRFYDEKEIMTRKNTKCISNQNNSIFAIALSLLFMPTLGYTQSHQILYQQGAGLYYSLCYRCHGDSGDSLSYPDIVPLAGITLRIPTAERISSLSAPFVGREFQGEEARALFIYLKSLRGEKGFRNPGHLMSPYLLEHKHSDRANYSVIDVRSRAEYEKAHIPHAIHIENIYSLVNKPKELMQRLGKAGVSPDTFIVIYDNDGGPTAASAWWAFFKHGHKRVAILDGGFKAWSSQHYETSGSVPKTDQAEFLFSELAQPEKDYESKKVIHLNPVSASAEGVNIHLTTTRDDRGFLHAERIEEQFQKAGLETPGIYRIEGSPEDSAFFLFLQQLLGNEPKIIQASLLVIQLATEQP